LKAEREEAIHYMPGILIRFSPDISLETLELKM
jgi:hypothetical protein